MGRTWSFGKKIGAGFAALVALSVITSIVGTYALRSVVTTMEGVISIRARDAILAQQLQAVAEAKASEGRGFLLSREDRFLELMRTTREEFIRVLRGLEERAPGPEDERLLADIERKEAAHQAGMERIVTLRKTEAAVESVGQTWEKEVNPKMSELRAAVASYTDRQERILAEEQRAASDSAARAVTAGLATAVCAVVLAAILALLLTRTLKRQIGSAIQHIQSSSTELKSAASQQASGAQEQATAMNEITVTVQELLATARQIAESAQRVAKIAEETASAAGAGDQTVQQAREAVANIKRQVDVIVSHMLDLGKKSLQIGGILEIINELAEQTSILSINATIEAAGGGELGKRFGAVADEIRKLADRVGTSTKEIRTLIDEVRAAVHTTVMATETGAKAVDAGTQQFSELASAFRQIVGMVGTTTEAAREIELSTKQQSTAVEQVNVATTNVAQASKESEASSLQTVQTASDLAKLSNDLALIIEPSARA